MSTQEKPDEKKEAGCDNVDGTGSNGGASNENGDDDSKTFYLFARTSREKEEWFNRLTVGAKFMQDWNHQNPPAARQLRPDPNYETYKEKEQRFKVFMEDYFQARHAEGAEKVHEMTAACRAWK